VNAPPAIASRRLTHAGLALASALLLWAAFLPYGLGFVAWVALVPWLVHVAWAAPGRAALCSYIGGLAFFLSAMYWLCYVALPGWIALSLYCALYWLAAALVIGWLWRRGCPLTLSAPLVVTSLEFVRDGFLTGFSFFFLGHTQHAYLPVIQIADVTGAYGVSFLIVAVNGCLADIALSRPAFTRRNLAMAGVVLALLAAATGYGLLRMRSLQSEPGPRVLMVQANVPQSLKISPTLKDGLDVLRRHIDLSRAPEDRPVDLVIWPETTLPAPMNIMLDDVFVAKLKTRPDYKEWAEYLAQCRVEWDRLPALARAHLLIGAETFFPTQKRRYNSAHFFSPAAEPLGRYDKIHIVVFGEYAPLEILRRLRPPVMGPDLNQGLAAEVFTLPFDGRSAVFGVTICYEDADPALFRRFVRNGAQFMVNMTNDGWFRDSMELDQHLALCVFRAVENRVGVARNANTGISALIAPDGRLLDVVTGPDGRRREVSGVLIGQVPLAPARSFYTRFGDLFAWLCIAAVAALAATLALRPRPQGDPHA
jgi:apolipoprotein N-acyltransferase